MPPILSIIVPVYNVEKTLRKCIKSIQNQTIRDIEILLVNDGSADDSLRICKEYERKDKRIIVVDQENKGVSAARNRGLEMAKGEYIGFVDADDWIEPDMFASLIARIREEDADVCLCNFYRDPEGTASHDLSFIDQDVITDKEVILEIVATMITPPRLFDRSHNIMVSVWRMLARRELLIHYRIIFPRGIPLMEDYLFVIQTLLKSRRVAIDRAAYYHYVRHSTSASHKHRYRENLNAILKQVYEKLENLLLEEQLYSLLKARMDILYIKMGINSMINEIHAEGRYRLPQKLKLVEEICKDARLKEAITQIDLDDVNARRKWILNSIQRERKLLLYAYYKLTEWMKNRG